MAPETEKGWRCRRWLEIVVVLAYLLSSSSAYSPYTNQARLYSEQGHLFIVGAEHSNITLKTSGKGFVNINDQDILHITNMARRSADFVERFQTSILPRLQSTSTINSPEIMATLKKVEAAIAGANSTGADLFRNSKRRLRLLTNRVSALTRVVRALRTLLARDECESSPCQHGGTCIDLFNGFHCQCPPEWQGSFCELDINECEIFEGTDFACRNGATCINLKGSYQCTCAPGWYGLQCNLRTYDCTTQSSAELCGHGICVNVGGTGRGFACICNEGWDNNPRDGTCTVDKNECENPHRPCSHDPYVECINTPGSFTCGSCPHGYSGNGYHCIDIDECAMNNGGCSTSPQVQCINTRGSRRCGSCPPGYIGDGITCTPGGRCQDNNGGCHPLATCQFNSGLGYVECRCPVGYTGPGVGPNGCTLGYPGNNSCTDNSCANGGTCIPTENNRYMCKCLPAFTGPNCSEIADPCASNPCQNGGTCKRLVLSMRIDYYKCICPQGYSGKTCSVKHEGCVGRYYGKGGVITWPVANQTLSSFRPILCAWTIETNRSKVINLTFTDFNFPSNKIGNKCTTNYVEIFDGESSSYPLIGHYCDVTPKYIVSTHPVLYVTARIYPFFRATLSMNWTAVDPHCGGYIYATTYGTIASPGSPGPYPLNAHCVWKLYTNVGRRIQLNFFTLDIENHNNCSFDSLEIHDGDSELSPLLTKLCNSSYLPPPIMSSGRQLTVIFRSDKSGKGFQIAYMDREGVPGCGGVLNQPRGQFSPPSLPGGTEYLESLNCEWSIQAPIGEKIRVQVESFSLEASEGCVFDYLEIFDGPSRDSGIMGRWCGKDTVPPVISTTNVLLVVFQSDTTTNEGGFVAKYTTVCDRTWTGSEGIISSPYYPNHYPEDRTCKLLIQRPIGSAIKLNFLDFDIEESEECIFDKLKIYDGNDENSPLKGEYCGSHKPGEIISTHNFLLLVIETDKSRHGRGFQANYTTIDVRCGGILTGKTGSLNSPRYPDEYPHDHDCRWIISTPPGTVIQLTWHSFNIERSYGCYRDWLKMFDNNTVQSYAGQLGDRYCGNTLPPSVTTSSNIMTVVFHTNRINAGPGFSASYIAITAENVCNAHFLSTMGEIVSPNYPNGYPSNIECQWTITVPDGQQIQLTPESFSIENDHRSCTSDFLEIRNGGHATSPFIRKYCGENFKKGLISTTNQLFLRFVSDDSVVGPGFKLLWNGALTGCGGVLTSPSGTIMSPNYPQPYGKGGECTWKITVAHGSYISLSIPDLDLEEHSSCAFDYIEIFDGLTINSPRLAKLCSQDHPVSINSKKNKMLIKFRSDMSRQGRGFHLKYNTVCNVTLTGFRGVIETPGFPDGDRVTRECMWNISAPIGNKVNITFSHFNVLDFRRNDCSRSFVKIYNGGNDAPVNLIGTYCNQNYSSGVITSDLPYVFIQYKTADAPRLYQKTSFRLEWIVSGCGGIYKNQKHGEITSPNYPNAYPHSTTCEWYISVIPGNSVKLTIDDLQIEITDKCHYDALEVYGGPDETSPNLAILCKKLSAETSSVLTTSGNSIFIRFRTDGSNSNKGFHATYDAVSSDCGGEFALSSGSIHSHNYPQNYDPHDDCGFLIKVDETHRVNLTFKDFDINTYNKNCTNGYVKVFDGDSEDSQLLETLCGNTIPSPILSSGNTMYIRHRSDGFSVAKGFLANFKPACGAVLTTDSEGIINFSETNTTLEMDYDAECTWIIRSKIPTSKIRMQFGLLETKALEYGWEYLSSNTSVQPGIHIYSGEGPDAPHFGHYYQSSLPTPFIVPSSVATILFKRSGDFHPSRFILHYSVLDTACGGTLIGESGSIVSPNYPDPYPNNIECIWTLVIAPGNAMSFEFTQFELQQSDSCNEDYVEIRLAKETGPLLKVYCGSGKTDRIDANGTLWIKFKSGPEGTAKGFEAKFALATHSDLTGFLGEVGSPLYPLPYYLANTFSWRITVKPRHVVRFAFLQFFIESMSEDSDDCMNMLELYDGFDSTAPILKTLCGVGVPEPFSSGSNVVFLQLKQLYTNMYTRFLFNWMTTPAFVTRTTATKGGNNCTTFVELKRGINGSYAFTSPGFPHGYGANLHCEWIFQAPPGDRIKVTFHTITLEVNSRCQADYITLYNGAMEGENKMWTQTERLCRDNDTKAYYGTRLVKVTFDSDYSVNKTGFSGKAWAVCGGELNEPNGVLTEDSYTQCQWNITVKPGRRIRISFDKFLIRGSPPCNINYLLLRDGGRPDSPFLGTGKYCGDSPPEVPETSSNRLYVEYHTSLTEGMIMKFAEKSAACGGTVLLSEDWKSTTITSPNYPQVPHPHTECIWQVFAPSGESVHFEITQRFDMTWSKGCQVEYLELRDGSTETAHLIGRYCSQTPNFVTTEDNALFIKYFTDTETPKDGFNATVSIAKCGGTIYTSGQKGTIHSPGYPASYDGNMNCTWRLVAPEWAIFSLNFTLTLGRARSYRPCNASLDDTVTLSENMIHGIQLEGPESVTMCGTKYMKFESETSEVLINFVSRRQPPHRGKRFFLLSYEDKRRKCGGDINLPSGVIQSPNYPMSHQGRMYCSWRITVPEGRRVTFNLIDLDLEPGTNRTRPQVLTFYNGHKYIRITYLTGSASYPQVIKSSGNKMMITYSSAYKTGRRGFIGNYTSFEPALCGGTITTPHSLFESNQIVLEESLLYWNSSFSCEWQFIRPSNAIDAGKTITFSFEGRLSYSLNPVYFECSYTTSMISFLDGNSNVLGEFCDTTQPNKPFVLSKPNDLVTVVQAYKSSIWSTEQRNVSFHLSWEYSSCGGVITVSSPVTISSPGETYGPGLDCVWAVSVAEGSTIKIRFLKFDLGPSCNDDYLKIHNGYGPRAPVMSTRCGTILPADIISQSSAVWIHFHSGAVASGKKGFSLQVSQEDSGCSGIFSSKTGEIQSPGYPSNYKNNLECEWEMHSPIGFHIGLTFSGRFFIESSTNCTNDYLEIYDFVDEAWSKLDRLCGRDLPKQYNSTSNRMKVLFRTNDKVSGDGFQAFFNWNCGGDIIVTGKGHLYSPGWPSNYPSGLDCNYTLIAPREKITLQTEEFNLEAGTSSGCLFDKVQFFTRERNYQEIKNNGIYCGQSIPPVQSSMGKLGIRFSADEWVSLKGFHMIYSISRCGREITNETMIFDPDTSSPYDSIECIWNITAPPNKIVNLKLTNLKLQRTTTCRFEFLAIYDTSNTSSNGTHLATICGHIKNNPVFFKSSGNRMRVYYKHNRAFDAGQHSFGAIITFGYGEAQGCGGPKFIDKSELEITSPDVDHNGQYEDNMDCIWTISTSLGNTILLNFDKIDLKPCTDNSTNNTASNICCDALEVYDGASANDMLIGKYCGHNKELLRSLSSSGSYLTLRFVTDDRDHGTGFKVRLLSHQSLCGPPILNVTKTPQILTSPNFPQNYPINVHCKWLLLSDLYYSFDIHFEVLDIENSTDCVADRLEISDDGIPRWRFRAETSAIQNLYYGGANPYASSLSYFPMGIMKFCGKGMPLDFYSVSNRVGMRFISDSHYTSKGFKIKYSIAGCSRNYTYPQGRIKLTRYRSAVSCEMYIIVPENNTVSLYFDRLSLYKSLTKCINYLEVFDNNNRTEICGFVQPPPIFSQSNVLKLKLTTSGISTSSIDITYTSTSNGPGCGGKFYNNYGIFTSSSYPGSHRKYSYCCWEITVPSPMVPKIVFTEFNIGLVSTCETDFVEMFDVNPETGNRIRRTTYCGGDTPSEFYGSGQTVVVCYKTSVHNGGIGFSATFTGFSEYYSGPALVPTV